MAYTTDDAILQVRRRAYLPPAGGPTDAEVLQAINEERRTTVADAITSAAPSFWRDSYDFTLVNGQSEYRVPDRALMSGVESVYYVDGSGNEFPVSELPASERWRYAQGARNPHWPARFTYLVDSEHLVVLPTPGQELAGHTMRVYYTRRMSEMVMAARAIAISLPNGTDRVEVSTPGSESTDVQTAGSYVDIVRGDGMFGPIHTDLVVVGYAPPDLEFDPSTPVDPSSISAYVPGRRRDYVCLAGETVYPEFPIDMWPALISAAAVAMLISTKDMSHYEMEKQVLERRLMSAARLAEPRSKDPDMIVNQNSTLRRGRRYGLR